MSAAYDGRDRARPSGRICNNGKTIGYRNSDKWGLFIGRVARRRGQVLNYLYLYLWETCAFSGFVNFRVPRRRRFVSGEAAKPAGGGGEATTGETKSQARAWLLRRNRRQAIRRSRPLSWSRVCAKLSNFQTYHADGVRGRAYAPCHKNL